MIKGVNRYVLEIPRPDSEYFEKAIFFVRPEHITDSETKLRSSAIALMEESPAPKRQKNGAKGIIAKVLHFIIAAGGGAAAAAAVFQLLN